MKRPLLIVLVLIVYGSLYPWQLRPSPYGNFTLSHFLFHSWPVPLSRGDYADILVNLIVYLPAGMFGFLALGRGRSAGTRLLLSTLVCLAVSLGVEYTQNFIPTRSSSLLDFTCNTASGALGALLAFAFRKSFTGVFVLILLWLAYQISFLGGLWAAAPSPPHISRLEIAVIVFGWFLAVCLLFLLRDQDGNPLWAQILAALAVGYLLVRQLSPFHLQPSPSRFSWIPFMAALQSSIFAGFAMLFQKCFFYGAAIWLLRAGRLRLPVSIATVAGLLAATEALQRYLPGRTPESTDPIIALLLGYILWEIQREDKRVDA